MGDEKKKKCDEKMKKDEKGVCMGDENVKKDKWEEELEGAEGRRKRRRALRRLRAGGANTDLTKDGVTSGRTGDDKKGRAVKSG